MLITINGVNVVPADSGKYQVAEVSYNREGKDEVKKVMSFAAPEVFKSLSAMKSFPTDVNITLKKEGKYWNWVGIEVAAASPKQAAGAPVRQSTYETPEERAKKQVYIVRQSSITAALDYLKHNLGDKKLTVDDVLGVAKQFEQYVFAVEVL